MLSTETMLKSIETTKLSVQFKLEPCGGFSNVYRRQQRYHQKVQQSVPSKGSVTPLLPSKPFIDPTTFLRIKRTY